MRKIIMGLIAWTFLLAIGWINPAITEPGFPPGFPPGVFLNRNAIDAAPSGGGGCSAATTFLARTSGLSGTETTAYTTMICGMISDGNGCSAWSGSSGTLDALYILATNNTTTAALNLCSSSYGATAVGSALPFTADQAILAMALEHFQG